MFMRSGKDIKARKAKLERAIQEDSVHFNQAILNTHTNDKSLIKDGEDFTQAIVQTKDNHLRMTYAHILSSYFNESNKWFYRQPKAYLDNLMDACKELDQLEDMAPETVVNSDDVMNFLCEQGFLADFVKRADYEALQRENNSLKKEREDLKKHCTELTTENQKLHELDDAGSTADSEFDLDEGSDWQQVRPYR